MSIVAFSPLIRRSRRRLFALLVLGCLLLIAGVATWWTSSRESTYRLRITGGVAGLNRASVAEYFQRHAGDVGLEIEVVPSDGSIDATRRLENGEVDLALVNALVRSPSARSVRQVAGITVEALHLLVKSEHAADVADDYGHLRTLSLNIGPEGSETELIAAALFGFCGLDVLHESNSNRLDRKSIVEMINLLSDLEAAASPEEASNILRGLPDVVVHVSTLPSPLAEKLIQVGGYELVPVPFAKAFSKITVQEEEFDADHIDEVHVQPATIPAFLYSVSPPTPDTDLATLGCPLILIAREDAPAEAIARILPAIYEGPLKRVFNPPSLADIAPTYRLHSASIAFRDRNQPLLRSDIAESIRSTFGILAPLSGGLLAMYGFYRWRQTLRFLEYFQEFQALDERAKGLTSDNVVTPAEAQEAMRLEAQLTRLQQRAVGDFCNNYFHGEGVLENFLQLLAETRDFLRASARHAVHDPDSPPESPKAARSSDDSADQQDLRGE